MLKYTEDLYSIVDHTAKHMAKETITPTVGRGVIALHAGVSIQTQLRDQNIELSESLAPVILLLKSSGSVHATPQNPASDTHIDGLAAAMIVLNRVTRDDDAIMLSVYELLADIMHHLTKASVRYIELETKY